MKKELSFITKDFLRFLWFSRNVLTSWNKKEIKELNDAQLIPLVAINLFQWLH